MSAKAQKGPVFDHKDKILVVIPFAAKEAQGGEIDYAIAGWRKHFKENFLLVIVGEGLEALREKYKKVKEVYCLESKRVDAIEGMYRQHLDYVSCFKAVNNEFPGHDGFIFAADDNYAVNDFDISDVKYLKMHDREIDESLLQDEGWQKDKKRTYNLLKEEGLPVRDFTTHIPCWFDFDKLLFLYDKYDMTHNSYVIEDIYYNYHFRNRIPLKLDAAFDNQRLRVWRPDPSEEVIRKAMEEKIWINNSVFGWCGTLQRLLKEKFGF